MELRHLRYYKAVAEQLNFSRAAEQLRVAQSALSRQIQALEQDVGVQLLDRDRSYVQLTDAGKAFYAHVCKLLLQVDVAVTHARQIARGGKGELVICNDWRLDAELITQTVEQFRQQNPGAEVVFRDGSDGEQIGLIRTRQADLGFVSSDLIAKKGELEFLPIRQLTITVVLPARHRLANRKLIRLADLAKETWVDMNDADVAGFRSFIIHQCRLSGFTPKIGETASNIDALFGYVASGCGITAVTDNLRPRRGAALRCVATDCTPIDHCAVWQRTNRSPLLRRYLEVLRKEITAGQRKTTR